MCICTVCKLLKKPTVDPDQLASDVDLHSLQASEEADLDLHCLQRQSISWFSRTRVKI